MSRRPEPIPLPTRVRVQDWRPWVRVLAYWLFNLLLAFLGFSALLGWLGFFLMLAEN